MPDLVAPRTGLAIPFRLPPQLWALRRRWDRAALAGAQPHVTILYPFLPPAMLTDATREALAAIAAGVHPFDVRFQRVRRWEDGLVWVEPEPVEPFRRVTGSVVERWPEHPPYEGLFDEVIVHMTLVESATAPLPEIERAARAAVPFTGRADRLELWRQDDAGRWRPHWRLRLGG